MIDCLAVIFSATESGACPNICTSYGNSICESRSHIVYVPLAAANHGFLLAARFMWIPCPVVTHDECMVMSTCPKWVQANLLWGLVSHVALCLSLYWDGEEGTVLIPHDLRAVLLGNALDESNDLRRPGTCKS
jgi:hypothetical protein